MYKTIFFAYYIVGSDIMCGIMGYIGDENATEIIIDGLENLEYRGYDSAGLAVFDGRNINIVKTVGSPSNLKDKTENITGSIGIGHTRWATHGAPTEENAHPHISENGLFTVVHNGIIENYAELKAELVNDGVTFRSDTDTEVIAHLLEKNYSGDLKGTVKTVLPMLKGSYALGILCRDYEDVIVCAKKSSPLFAGTAKDTAYLASDISALADKSDRIFRLNDGEIGFLKSDSFKVYDIDGCRIKKSEVRIKASDKVSGKNGYEHFMLKEIHEQPDAVRNTLSEIIKDNRIKFRNFRYSKEELSQITNVRFVACGSAYHVGTVGAYATERLAKRVSCAHIASEFRYSHPHLDENSLVVIISQSGETADTLAALRIAKQSGAKTISIVNVENSTIAQESDCVIMTRAGREIAVATTKAYSAQLCVVYAIAVYLAQITENTSKSEALGYIEQLKTIPDKIEQILSNTDYIKALSERVNNAKYICFIGRGFDYCAAMEASLKLKEISYIPCEAYAAGELKHGTISLIDGNSLIIALNCCDEISAKTQSNIDECSARKANIITVSHNGDITVPETDDIFSPMLEVIPMQLLAYHTAKLRGCAIDKPKNLAKSVTVE